MKYLLAPDAPFHWRVGLSVVTVPLLAGETSEKAPGGTQAVPVVVKRMQVEVEKLVGRIRRDAGALAARSRREGVSGLVADARKFKTQLRKRSE